MNTHAKPREFAPSGMDPGALQVVRPKNRTYALGLACEFSMTEPAFTQLGFADWCQVLAGQIARDHYFFVLDRDNTVVGFAGWALSDHESASAWLEQSTNITSDHCTDGDCVILNAWIARSPEVRKFMTAHGMRELSGKTHVFAKRIYPDGRMKPVKTLLSEVDPDLAQ